MSSSEGQKKYPEPGVFIVDAKGTLSVPNDLSTLEKTLGWIKKNPENPQATRIKGLIQEMFAPAPAEASYTVPYLNNPQNWQKVEDFFPPSRKKVALIVEADDLKNLRVLNPPSTIANEPVAAPAQDATDKGRGALNEDTSSLESDRAHQVLASDPLTEALQFEKALPTSHEVRHLEANKLTHLDVLFPDEILTIVNHILYAETAGYMPYIGTFRNVDGTIHHFALKSHADSETIGLSNEKVGISSDNSRKNTRFSNRELYSEGYDFIRTWTRELDKVDRKHERVGIVIGTNESNETVVFIKWPKKASDTIQKREKLHVRSGMDMSLSLTLSGMKPDEIAAKFQENPALVIDLFKFFYPNNYIANQAGGQKISDFSEVIVDPAYLHWGADHYLEATSKLPDTLPERSMPGYVVRTYQPKELAIVTEKSLRQRNTSPSGKGPSYVIDSSKVTFVSFHASASENN